MAAAAPFLMLAFGAVQAVSSIKQANAAQEAAEFNAQTAQQNAQLAREKGVEDERIYRIQSRKAMGEIQSGYAAAGLSLEGSPSDVLAEAAANAEHDVLKIQQGASLQATMFEREAGQQRKKGGYAMTAGYLGAAGSLLSGAAQYGAYSDYGSTTKLKSGGSYPGQDY